MSSANFCFLRQRNFQTQPFQTALTLSYTDVDAWLEVYWMPLQGFCPLCTGLPCPLLSWPWAAVRPAEFTRFPLFSHFLSVLSRPLTPASALCPQGYVHGQSGGHVRSWLLFCLLLGAPKDCRTSLHLAESLKYIWLCNSWFTLYWWWAEGVLRKPSQPGQELFTNEAGDWEELHVPGRVMGMVPSQLLVCFSTHLLLTPLLILFQVNILETRKPAALKRKIVWWAAVWKQNRIKQQYGSSESFGKRLGKHLDWLQEACLRVQKTD